ncbi:restriction endonuclease subunit S [Candidatus Mycoplasma haematohominis]|uniref:restriction endonuclease subunit S n=1 Tax=Candidatus Mycoplasma haematohominis TaxID=1494318 RepID=UPI001C0A6BF1|nr:restriction endonuclease subunit S [Candidatus Mycoplasma haemohominis]
MGTVKSLLNKVNSGGQIRSVSIEEIAETQRGFSFNEKKYRKSGLPIIKVLNVQNGEINTKELVYFDKKDYSKDLKKFLLKPGEVCITTSGASSGKIAFNNHQQDFYISSTVCKFNIKPQLIISKYLYYSLLCIQKDIHDLVRGGAVKGLPVEKLKKLIIPLPSIKIQEKITETLDLWVSTKNELNKDLSKELTLRKQQYEYYRDKLISDVIDKGTGKYKTLNEIVTEIYRGNGIKKEHIGSGTHPYIVYGEIYTKYNIKVDKCISSINPDLIPKKRYCEYGDLLVTLTGENTKEIAKVCAYLDNKKCIAGWGLFVLKHKQNPRYLAYALSTTQANLQKEKLATLSTLANISAKAIQKIKIPIPPLEIQEKIANFLDQLRSLTEELEKDIRQEIKLANERYKHYRDSLILNK